MAMHGAEHIGGAQSGAAPAGRRAAALAWLLLALVVAGSALLRVQVARADPGFDAREPRRMLWSDPALLYYFTQRIVEHGGSAPPELRADPSFQWPDRVDALAFETVGQEYFAAWWHLLLGGGQPLLESCLESMALAAACAAIGVFVLGAELAGGAWFGLLAASLWAILPASYRTLGIVLLREDLALPCFALHLGLLAVAARRRTPVSFVACGLALLAALATWHAMGFVAAIEAAVVLAWFLRTGRNPFAVRWAWLVPATVAAGSLLVPVLRAKVAILSLPMQVAAGLLVAAAAARVARPRAWRVRAAGLAGVVAAAGAALLATRLLGAGIGDYSHVVRLLLAKARFLGELPADPRALDFEARLLWQGPFETASLFALATGTGIALLPCGWLMATQFVAWWRGRGDDRRALLAAFLALALLAAWLVVRTEVVFGVAAPVAAAVAVAALRTRALQAAAAAALLALAAALFVPFVRGHRSDWYSVRLAQADGSVRWVAHPRQANLPRLLEWIEREVPADAAVCADLVTSTAILAHTRRPIVLQPKYESVESRRRIELFLTTLFHGTPADLAALLGRWRCRWLALDVKTLGIGSLYLAGLRDDGSERPAPGSAADLLLGPETPAVPGFRLRWRDAADARREQFRVYELVSAE